MSVYTKLNDAREKFHALPMKKTGENKFAKYNYFELGDFLVPALNVFKECGLCAYISFGTDLATMTIVDTDPNVVSMHSSLTITSPMSTAALKGCHEVQNLGAVQTYLRRYLWVAALEIVENDALDATTGKKGDGPIIPARPATDSLNLSEESMKYIEELVVYVKDCFNSKDIAAAKDAIKNANLDSEEEIALNNMLDSKIRSELKKV